MPSDQDLSFPRESTQQGFLYETNATKVLKKIGFTPPNFRPAGSSSSADLVLLHKTKTANCELKIKPASAGSLVLRWTPEQAWHFSSDRELADNPEKLFLKGIAIDIGLYGILAKKWPGIPLRRDKDRERDEKWQALSGHLTDQQRYHYDFNKFHEIKATISPSVIEQYYNKKQTFYINVGTHGFYKLGSRNPYNLNIPAFSSSAGAVYRARVQNKGGHYQFTFDLNFNIRSASPYNIAPVRPGDSSMTIQKQAMNMSCFN